MEENSMDGQPSRRKLCNFQACTLKILNKEGDFAKIHESPVQVVVWSDNDGQQCLVDVQDGIPFEHCLSDFCIVRLLKPFFLYTSLQAIKVFYPSL